MSSKQSYSRIKTITPNWPAPANVVALSTTRTGGYSQYPFDSLNLGDHVGDNPGYVQKNRQLIVNSLNLPAEPRWLNQTHSTNIQIQTRNTNPQICDADGSFSAERGLVCAVMTADCMPLLLCNRAGTKVAAVHAGWKGMADGIIEHAVEVFDELPEGIIAWAGPTIGANHFEIGEEVKQQLAGSNEAYQPSINPGKWMANLYLLASERLAALGIHNYQHSDLCTYADKDRFFSYRRDIQTGRTTSLIYLV